jgi:predicted transcriptional regulator
VPIVEEDDYEKFIKHYGTKRKSGRYPYGSGGDESELGQATAFQKELRDLRSKGMSDSSIAESFGLTTPELRANIAISGLIKKQDEINTAQKLKGTGMSASEIAREMYGSSSKESTVRGLLSEQADRKQAQLENLANTLKQRVDESSGYIDVGKGTEHHFQVTKTKFDTALAMLQTEGYVVETVLQPNATTSHDTRVRVLAKPGETWSSIRLNKHLIEPAKAFSNDGGQTFRIVQEPLKLNPARLDIQYGDKGGADADGVIYIRPGVDDLTLNGASYAQVRIQVGPKHYIKGMAVMKEGLPPGVDVQFNTNKKDTGNKLDALKPVKANSDPLERFGAVFRQLTYDSGPNQGKVKSHLNIVNDEDDWDDWSKSLATQMLSKQKPDFVKRQLDVTYAQKKAQLDEIMQLTNPVVKKELLRSYADDMDASSVHLKAAALPRQKTHVLIPVNSLKDNEVYAPGYDDGEKVVLIRYPHGGKFEIPELVVNNRNKDARAIMDPSKTRAAIGINSRVAGRLSGADFDGDTVVVIPNNRGRVQTDPPLAKLKNFDPQEEYRGSKGLDANGKHIPLPGVTLMKNTQTQMGQISNLITDMTIGGATHEELARAVRHSMVVIDAEKHGLDYKRSANENSISALKKKYQPGRYGGASTIISRTSRDVQVPDFKRRPQAEGGGTDPKTGEPIYVPTGKTNSKRVEDPVTGEVTWVKTPKMAKVATGSRIPGARIKDPVTGETRPITDAYDLVSGPADIPKGMRGQLVERHYAEYSNQVRGLANQARLAELNTADPRVNPSAKKVYNNEVASLKAKLKVAQANSPIERSAQTAAQVIIKMKREENPDLTPDQLKRVKSNAINTTRSRLGAKPQRVDITDREWEAIQNGAVASAVLREILTKADMDRVRDLAQPKTDALMTSGNTALARALMSKGKYTRAEIAQQLGVSLSTLDRALA